MTDDLLREAARDLRRSSNGDSADPQPTRGRILASIARRRRRRQTWTRVTVTIVGLLALSSAWAAASGRMPALWRSLVHRIAGGAAASPAHRPAAPTARPDVPATSQPTASAAPVVGSAQATEGPAARRRAPTVAPRAPEEPDREGQIFRDAYHDHFVTRDPAAALAGWDHYLRVAPGGRFALEASYNRALCLVRLGRRAEAIVALTPFADGVRGDYRQREARRLIDALAAEPSP
jgi:hypothetical protein